MRVLLVPNLDKEKAVAAVAELSGWLVSEGHTPLVVSEDAAVCGVGEHAVTRTEVGEPDLAVALGGDGTILRAVHILGDVGTPLLGINFGRMGFLAGADDLTAKEALAMALAGEAREERRMTLQAVITVDGREVGHYHALNEVFVGRSAEMRVVDLAVSIDGAEVVTYVGDGIVVATPTGSTAYALSAGGPIVAPEVEGIVVVPVAPHTLATRSFVIGRDDTVEVSCSGPSGTVACVTVDGDTVPCRQTLEQVRVWKGTHDVTLLKLDGRDFFDVVRGKLLGG